MSYQFNTDIYKLSDTLKVTFTDANQIFGMGGPYVSEVMVNNKVLPGTFMVYEPLLNKETGLLALISYHNAKMRLDCHFRIVVIDLNKHEMWESMTKFESVFVDAIHGINISYRRSLAFPKEGEKNEFIEFQMDNFTWIPGKYP